MSNSLRPHGLQHTRLFCPSPIPRAYSNSCLSSQWCHPTISSSVVPFFSCLQSFPASGCFPMSQFFTSGSQSIEVSASASVLPMSIQDWSPLGCTGWISLQSKGLSRVFSNSSKALILWCSAFFIVQLSHPYMTTGKTILLTSLTFNCIEDMILLQHLNQNSRVKHTIYWENQTNKSCLASHRCVTRASSHHFQGTRESKWDTIR